MYLDALEFEAHTGEMIFLQEIVPESWELPARTIYYAVTTIDGGEPIICFVDTLAEQPLQDAAVAHDVTLEVLTDEEHVRPYVIVSGAEQAMKSFVIDRLTSALACGDLRSFGGR